MEAYTKQNGLCAGCGKEMSLTERAKELKVVGDHRIPLAKGGSHNRWNIQAMHKKCNEEKGANTLSEEAKRTGQTIVQQLTHQSQMK